MAKKITDYPKEYLTKQAIKDSDVMSMQEKKDLYVKMSRMKNRRITMLEQKFDRAQTLLKTDRAPSFKSFLDKGGNVDMNKFSSELSETATFLNRDNTTISGFRKQLKSSIDSFNRLFEDNPINEENIFDLYDFLEDYRQKYKVQDIPDSDEVIDVWVEAQRLNISSKSLLKDIDYWSEHYEDMQDLEPVKSQNPVSSNVYKRKLM